MTDFVNPNNPYLAKLHEIAVNANISSLNSVEFATAMDAQDELKSFRDEFCFPIVPEGKHPVYLCGNSLGLQPKRLKGEVIKQLDKWADQAVEGHFTGEDKWVEVEAPLNAPLARLVGAKESEVVAMNSLTCNLHVMMSAFYRPTPQRYKIVIEKKAFPSDYHAVISQLHLHGFDPNTALIEIASLNTNENNAHLSSSSSAVDDNALLLDEADIQRTIAEHGESIALILFSGVQYYTGQVFPLEKIAQWGHAVGAVVGFDLAHAVGNIPLRLHDINCDFACWCSYKYLNCGPGAMAGCFVHEKHGNVEFEEPSSTQEGVFLKPKLVRLGGWWGHRIADRFVMKTTFTPESGANGFRLSNPPVLLVSCLKASLSVFDEAGIDRLRHKSLHLTSYLEYLLKTELGDVVTILTPTDPHQRGCQLSLTFNNSDVTCDNVLEELGKEGVIGDVRKPSVIRIAPAPLYNSYLDVFEFVQVLKKILVK